MKFDKIKSGLLVFIENFGNLVILNLLFTICCIPIISIPAALTAMNSCALSMARGEGFEARRFWRVFKGDFLISLILGLIAALGIIILAADAYILAKAQAAAGLIYVLYALCFMLAAALMYLFPLVARFSFKLGQYLRLSLGLAVKNLPQTILMLLMNLLPLLLLWADVEMALHLAVLWFIFGFALTAYLDARMLHEIFRPYIPEAGEREGNA